MEEIQQKEKKEKKEELKNMQEHVNKSRNEIEEKIREMEK